jgi:hypothetical protein
MDHVERAARALYTHPLLHGVRFSKDGWGELAQAVRDADRKAGFVLVPVEPTEAMVHVAFCAWQNCNAEPIRVEIANHYRAMIAAASSDTCILD